MKTLSRMRSVKQSSLLYEYTHIIYYVRINQAQISHTFTVYSGIQVDTKETFCVDDVNACDNFYLGLYVVDEKHDRHMARFTATSNSARQSPVRDLIKTSLKTSLELQPCELQADIKILLNHGNFFTIQYTVQ